MIASISPYAAMKDSGVRSLGHIPEHWEVRRLKHVCSLRSGEGITAEAIEPQGDYPVFGGNGLRGFAAAYTHEGQFPLIGRQGALCGNVHLASGRFWASEHAVVAYPRREIDPKWLAHALRAMELRQHSIAAAQPGLAVERIVTLPICVPPPFEQAAIVRFLDDADRRIRRYVRAKQKLIKLLDEQKQAIIRRAVTRGLHRDVPVKPSGVEGVGEVPQHWRVWRAKFVFDRVDIRSSTGAEELLTVSSREGVVRRAQRDVTMFMAASYVGHKLCWPEDLVINSLWAWANGLGFARHHGIVSTAYGVYRLRPPFRDLWQYLDYALRSGAYDWQFHVRSRGIWKSRLQLTDWSFLDMPLVLPPPEEARAICRSLEAETAEIREAAEKTSRELSLLREYRSRLTADVVTGKLDVREAAARLPEEADEIEPLDEADGIDEGEDPASDEVEFEEVEA